MLSPDKRLSQRKRSSANIVRERKQTKQRFNCGNAKRKGNSRGCFFLWKENNAGEVCLSMENGGEVYDVVGEHRDQLSVHTCTCVDEEIKNI